MERSLSNGKHELAGWPPTPQSLLSKPLAMEEMGYDASFSLLPPPLLAHPPIFYAPFAVPIPHSVAEQHNAPASKSTQPPSPLSLSDAEMEDADATEEDEAYDPDSRGSTRKSSPNTSMANVTSTRPSAARKASHSIIERRRRERINETLARLVELVPGCKSALRAKDEKTARSRRRSKRADTGSSSLNVGGLHKLDVLLATVAYVEDLHKRLGISGDSSATGGVGKRSSPHVPAPIAPVQVIATDDVNSAAASLLALASPVVQPVRDV